VLFYAQMAKEGGTFSIDQVLDRLSDKLVRRHPHVFGDVKADTTGEVLRNWEAIKAQEKAETKGNGEKPGAPKNEASKPDSVLAGVSAGLPALLEAGKLSSRAANVGFDWPNIDGLFDKLHEEIEELHAELRDYPAPGPQPRGKGIAGSGRAAIPEGLRLRLEEEVGDLFFVLVNISRFLALDSELALKKTNRKFRRRFQQVESKLQESGRSAQQASLEELEALWQAVKLEERAVNK
jgi:nucleoside triphosphate diphosphatase